MRSSPSPRRARLSLGALSAEVLAACAVIVVTLFAAAVVLIHPTVNAVAQDTGATVGGLHYRVNNGWILGPHRRVDTQVARGLPASDRHLPADELLYAVFVGVTNETNRDLPMANHIVLRSDTNRTYAPVPLSAANRYAYRARTMAPQTHRPAPWTPAGKDLSAEGLMLVFRIPRRAYQDGSFQLELRDPRDPSVVRSVEVL